MLLQVGVAQAELVLDGVISEDDAGLEPPPNNFGSQTSKAPPSAPPSIRSNDIEVDEDEGDPSTRQSHRNKMRAMQRRRKNEEEMLKHKERMVSDHILNAEAVTSKIVLPSLPATTGGYCGTTSDPINIDRTRSYTVQELTENMGFKLIEIDASSRRSIPFVDKSGRIFGVAASGIGPRGYQEAISQAHDLVQSLAELETFTEAETHHRRGCYPCINFGISMGQGQKRPQHLNLGGHRSFVEALLRSEPFRRIAGFNNGVFKNWAPKLHAYYEEALSKVETTTNAKRYFPFCAFSCATINIGPNVYTCPHRDMMNLGYGWCAITSLGKYDHKRGGHLILWDAKLVIEFPVGWTMLIPSATLMHSNTPIAEGEVRSSFTQYTAGGLFRWVENKCKTDKELQKDKKRFHEIKVARQGNWLKGLGMMSTLEELNNVL